MKRDDRPSAEMLNAYVDGQFSPEDRRRVLEWMAQDAALGDEVCELRKTKALLQMAYEELPGADSCPGDGQRRQLWGRAAALLVVFLAGGLLGHFALTPEDTLTAQAVAPLGDEPTRVLVHLNDNDPAVAFEVLTDLERLLGDYAQRGEAVNVEVVANGDGLELLRVDTTPIAEEIVELIARYDNLMVAACRTTLDQQWEDYGLDVELLPGVQMIDSGVVRVIERQQEGWAYIRG